MPHRNPLDSPTAADLAAQEADANSPVTRREFRALREDVHAIKLALVGDNALRPDKDAMVARVDSHERDINQAKWLSRTAIGGVIAAGATYLWNRLTGTH